MQASPMTSCTPHMPAPRRLRLDNAAERLDYGEGRTGRSSRQGRRVDVESRLTQVGLGSRYPGVGAGPGSPAYSHIYLPLPVAEYQKSS
jgi:hypothetical protein